ncbi:MAG: hypothetical protein PSX81_00560 [bacterium]|nr:hypothetical protein [bacterium]
MKTKITSLAIAIFSSVLFMGGCLEKITAVNFDYTTTASLKSDSLRTVGTQSIDTVALKSDLESELKKKGTSLDLLDELTLKSATIGFTAPTASDNFDKIDAIELWVFTPTLPPLKLATKNPILKGLNIVSLDVASSTNLEEYLKSETYTLQAIGTNNAPLGPMDLTVSASWTIKASAK